MVIYMSVTIKTPHHSNTKTTMSLRDIKTLQIDLYPNIPTKKIKHKKLNNQQNIKIESIIHKNKTNIYRNHYNKTLEPSIKPLINNIALLYNKSLLGKHKIPLNIYLEDFDKTNLDPEFLFYNQKSKYKYSNPYFGLTYRIGSDNQEKTTIKSIQIKSAIQNPHILVHELGHALDFAYCNDYQLTLSESDEFQPIIKLYTDTLYNINKNKSNIKQDSDFIYFTLPTEIFARCFQKWYDAEIQQYHPNTELRNIFNPYDKKYGVEKQHRIGESIVYKLYNDHPEIQQFFTKHFGGIIPPENTKLFNKEKWDDLHTESTSPSDTSLLKKLSNIMCQTGLSQKEQSLNDIDLDY